MVKIKRMMEKGDDGFRRQFFPQTHVSAVIGLEKLAFSNAGVSPETATKSFVSSSCRQVLEEAKRYADSVSESGGELIEIAIATTTTVGTVSVGDGLKIDTSGRLSLLKQFTAGANISISESGVISATGGSDTGGVNQEYVDQKAEETLSSAKEYTYSKGDIDSMIQPGLVFEKIGVV